MAKKRKTLSKFLLALIINFLAVVFPVCNSHIYSSSLAEADDRNKSADYIQEINKIIQKIQSEFSIDTLYTNFDQDYRDKKFSYDEIEKTDYKRAHRFISIFYEEISKYPPDFFSRFGLKYVVFVKKLFHKERNAQGLYDAKEKVIFFDINESRGGRLAIRHNIHHELFHMMEMNTFYWKGMDWNDFNDPDFKYPTKGIVYFEPGKNKFNLFAPKQLGFVTHYAMASMHEDKAEVFACLMIKAQSKLMQRWSYKDVILKKKIEYIKKFLLEYSNGQMNDQYFKELWSTRHKVIYY